MNGTQFEDINYDELDPGIREVVRRLNNAGFTTTDSGDGVSKPEILDGDALDFPHVYMVEMDDIVGESVRLRRLVESWGIAVGPVGSKVWIQASFDPCDDQPSVIMLAGVNDSMLGDNK